MPEKSETMVELIADRIQNHYQCNPFRLHLAAWAFVAIPMGFTLMPRFSVGSIIGFLVAAMIVSMVLCVLTYPFSSHFSFTIAGAFIGLIFVPLVAIAGLPEVPARHVAPACLIVGALVGSTSLIWQAPLRVFVMLGRKSHNRLESFNRSSVD